MHLGKGGRATMTGDQPGTVAVVTDPLRQFSHLLEITARTLESGRHDTEWSPPFSWPAVDDPGWSTFFGQVPVAYYPGLTNYRSTSISLLDLMTNPNTRTTKSLASSSIIARAAGHVASVGRSLTIVTPTSGNKGSALRDALARAKRLGLPGTEQLRVVVVVPQTSIGKLRSCIGDVDPAFTARNPVVVMPSDSGAEVKAGVADAVSRARGKSGATDFWQSLALDNYRAADVIRAFVEHEFDAPRRAVPRLQVHAVSSGYGLLGYQLGCEILEQAGEAPTKSQFLLVQHLGAPDMVLHAGAATGLPSGPPAYRSTGQGWVQRDDPRFPAVTDDPAEVLDPTFYTRNPPTAEAMTALISSQGGAGIVVSKRECRARYDQIAHLLSPAIEMPANPDELREWSLVMAMCGLITALDRDLIGAPEAVVHASGSYTDATVAPFPQSLLTRAEHFDELVEVLAR